jgi:hypothetical protein
MTCDIYYSTEIQNKYGKMEKTWIKNRSSFCSFYYPTAKKENFKYEDQQFYKLDTYLLGRAQKDPRLSNSGEYYPLSHILITNIKNANCGDSGALYIETNKVATPTIFEIRSVLPNVNPFGNIEFYSVELERQDKQEMN